MQLLKELSYDEKVRLIKILAIVFFLFVMFTIPAKAYNSSCPSNSQVNVTYYPNPVYANSGNVTFTFSSSQKFLDQQYTFAVWKPGLNTDNTVYIDDDRFIVTAKKNGDNLTATIPIVLYAGETAGPDKPWTYKLWLGDQNNLPNGACVVGGTFIVNGPQSINQQTGQGAGLPAIRVDTTIWQAKKDQTVYIVNAQPQYYTIWFNNDSGYLFSGKLDASQIGLNTKYRDIASAAVVIPGDKLNSSDSLKTLCMSQSDAKLGVIGLSCDFSIPGINIVPILPKVLPPSVISNQIGVPSSSAPPQIPSVCPNDTCQTAFGPISTKPLDFVKSIFGILLSLSGGIALILIIISGYRIMFSQGN